MSVVAGVDIDALTADELRALSTALDDKLGRVEFAIDRDELGYRLGEGAEHHGLDVGRIAALDASEGGREGTLAAIQDTEAWDRLRTLSAEESDRVTAAIRAAIDEVAGSL